MVNTNIQGPVQLSGRGFVARPAGHFEPGEYQICQNVEYVDNRLRSRRAIKHAGFFTDNTDPFVDDACCAVGHWDDYVIYAGKNGVQYAVSDTESIKMFNVTDLFTTKLTSFVASNTKLLSFFTYNNTHYWLVYFYSGRPPATAMQVNYYKLFSLPASAAVTPSSVNSLSFFGDGGTYDVEDASIDIGMYGRFSASLNIRTDPSILANRVFLTDFMFKDRYWIAFSDRILFSKATDPNDFSVPNGGFIDLPDVKFKWVVALKDSLYIICDTSVYIATFDTDPNTDLVIRKISDNIGGEHAIIFKDTPMFINKVGIYSIINNSYVDLVNTSDLDVGENNFDYQRLSCFGDYLVINKGNYNYEGAEPQAYFRYNRYRNPHAEIVDASNGPSITGGVLSQPVAGKLGGANKCFRITGNNTSATVSLQTATPALANGGIMEINPNMPYAFNVWLRHFGIGAATTTLAMSIIQYDENFVVIPADPDLPGSVQGITTLSAAYQNFDFQFKSKPGAKYCYFFFQVTKTLGNWTNTMGVDLSEFMFEESSKVDSSSLVSHSTFNYDYTDNYDFTTAGPTSKMELLYSSMSRRGTLPLRELPDPDGSDSNTLGVNLYFLNMENGFMHTVSLPNDANLFDARALDVYVNDTNKVLGPKLYILGGVTVSAVATQGFFYMAMESILGETDSIANGLDTNTSIQKRIPVTFVINNFFPDGNEYMMKKFRNLEVQGIFPQGMGILYATDDSGAVVLGIVFDQPNTSPANPHFPHRFGINARGRAISFHVGISDYNPVNGGSETWGPFEISDMRVLWGYTGRAPTTASYGSGNP